MIIALDWIDGILIGLFIGWFLGILTEKKYPYKKKENKKDGNK